MQNDNLAEGSSILMINRDMVAALTAVLECHAQAPFDLVGEQREWYLPRLSKAFSLLAKHFPKHAGAALSAARDPWGDLVGGNES